MQNQNWNSPEYKAIEFRSKRSRYCLCVFVLNETGRLQSQLEKMRTLSESWDIIIADGGSTDGCNNPEILKTFGLRALLVKEGPGKLGAQMRMAFNYAIGQGYEGVITVDGNDKDDVVSGLPLFAEKLDSGFDHIQGSRFITGGIAENTPLARLLGVKFLHAPLISLSAGVRYTDTTNGFRAYSKKFLNNSEIAGSASQKDGYDLHYYLAIKSGNRRFRSTEVPVARRYPKNGTTPTKIHGVRGNANILRVLIKEVLQSTNLFHPYVKFALSSLIFCLSFMLFRWTLKSADFTLSNFSGQVIGQVVVSGIDAGKRSIFLILGYALLSFAIFSSWLLFNKFKKSCKEDANSRVVQPSNKTISSNDEFALKPWAKLISTLSVFTAYMSALDLVNFGEYGVLFAFTSSATIVLSFVFALLVVFPRAARKARLPSIESIGISASISFSTIMIFRLFLYKTFFITPVDGYVISICAFVLPFLDKFFSHTFKTIYTKRLHYSNNRIERLIPKVGLLTGILIVIIPTLIILGNEIQYIFALRQHALSMSQICGSLFALLLGVLVLFSRYSKSFGVLFSNRSSLSRLFWILSIVSMGLTIFYTRHVSFDYGDLFHSSEAILPPLQYANFRSTPWINIFPTHGFADHTFSYLHAALSGMRDFEIMGWNWIRDVVFFVLSTVVFRALFGSIPALILSVCFSSLGVSSADISMGPVALGWLISAWIITRKQKFSAIFGTICLYLLFFYYPAVGVPLLVGGVVTLVAFAFVESKLADCIKALTIGACVLIALLVTSTFIRIGNLEPVLLWVEFVKVQAQSMSYNNFVRNDSIGIASMYAAQPILVIGVGALSLARIFAIRDKICNRKSLFNSSYGLWFALFSSVAILISYNRFVQRHGMIESGVRFEAGWSILFLLGLIVFWWNPANSRNTNISTSSSGLCAKFREPLFVLFVGILALARGSVSPLVVKDFPISIKPWMPGAKRFTGAVGQPKEVSGFLSKNLKEGQTFYDFSNSPSLYVSTGAKFPTFIIPTLYHTSASIQRSVLRDLEALRRSGRLPFVVYERTPNGGGWDALDGVENSVRSFLIAEFIFQNYKPCARVGNFGIWCERLTSDRLVIENIEQVRRERSLGMLASIWGRYDKELTKRSAAPAIAEGTFVDEKTIKLDRLPETERRSGLGIIVDACSTDFSPVNIYGESITSTKFRMFSFSPPVCNFETTAELRIPTRRELGSITEKTLEQPMGGIESLFQVNFLTEISYEGPNRDWIHVMLKPSDACKREHETRLLSKGIPAVSITRKNLTIGCGKIKVLAKVRDLAKILLTSPSQTGSDALPKGHLSPIYTVETIDVGKIHTSRNFIRLGMNPSWFAADLSKLYIERDGTNVTNVRLISVD